jgi:hypothetical protein
MTTIQDLSRTAAETTEVVVDATRQAAALAAEGLRTAAGAAGAGAESLRAAAPSGEEVGEWLSSLTPEQERRGWLLEGAALAVLLVAILFVVRRSRSRRVDAADVPPPQDLAPFQPVTTSSR